MPLEYEANRLSEILDGESAGRCAEQKNLEGDPKTITSETLPSLAGGRISLRSADKTNRNGS